MGPRSHRFADLLLPGDRRLPFGRSPLVMGVLNITPDSFSDGGRWLDPDRALARAEAMIDEGADLLDLGAESTRPGGGVYGEGARDVPPGQEIDRLLPVLEALRGATDLPLSVDTRKAEVAAAALKAGADLVNDVGGLSDPDLGPVVASAHCPLILMHSRGSLRDMQRAISFDDVVEEVAEELGALCDRAIGHGIAPESLVVDPGIGFGKTREQNLALIAGLGRLEEVTGRPVLLGASRKSFISRSVPPDRRLGGSLAAVAWAVVARAAIVRVHDVAETRQFLDLWDAVDSARPDRPD